MVGAVRFELTTSCTRNKRATRLRYAPTLNTTSCGLRLQLATSKLQKMKSGPAGLTQHAVGQWLPALALRRLLQSGDSFIHRLAQHGQALPHCFLADC